MFRGERLVYELEVRLIIRLRRQAVILRLVRVPLEIFAKEVLVDIPTIVQSCFQLVGHVDNAIRDGPPSVRIALAGEFLDALVVHGKTNARVETCLFQALLRLLLTQKVVTFWSRNVASV